jgi:hypothetical protein
MNKMKPFAFTVATCLFCACFPDGCEAQTGRSPQWLLFLPPKTETYYYRVSQASAKTEEAALKKAFAMAIYESAFAVGIAVDLGKLVSLSDDSTNIVLSKAVNIPVNVVCKYVEALTTKRGYKAYVLCQVANDVRIKPKYNTFNCLLNREEK